MGRYIKAYDLVLVVTAFQRNCLYASIIKELGHNLKIGLFVLPLGKNSALRILKTQQQFLDLCISLGAGLICNGPVETKIEILGQAIYSKEDIKHLNQNVRSAQTYWLVGVAMGNATFDKLHQKRIDKVLVPDKGFYDYRLKVFTDDGVKFTEKDIIEIGMPYGKYPLIKDDLNLDYIVATPTPFSFLNAYDRLEYLERLNYVLKEITHRGCRIGYKPHNADERNDYIVKKEIIKLLSIPLVASIVGLIEKILRNPQGKKFLHKAIRNISLELSIGVQYKIMQSYVIQLSDLTKFHKLNLEIFLPQVHKGLITGRSNSIWHALYLKKEVWNLIAREKDGIGEAKMHKY